MELLHKLQCLNGVLNVNIEGFFIERVVNVCKNKGIPISNVRNLNDGLISVNIPMIYFKKLKEIAKMCKCKIKINRKTGLYFIKHRYRKRIMSVYLMLIIIIIYLISSTFIWKIKVIGNTYIDSNKIVEISRKNGAYIGRNRFFININSLPDKIRLDIPELSWVGVIRKGTSIVIEVKERNKKVDVIDESKPVNIVAKKEGVITKVVVANGTKIIKEGEYVFPGNIVICGIIESQYMDPLLVHAQGNIYAKVLYSQEYKILLNNKEKEYKRKGISIGFTLNSKDSLIHFFGSRKFKYEDNLKYIGGVITNNKIGFIIGTYNGYIEKDLNITREQAIINARETFEKYIRENIEDKGKILDKFEKIVDNGNEIIVECKIYVEEEISLKQEMLIQR